MMQCMKTTGLTFRRDESTRAGVLRITDGLIRAALHRARHHSSDPEDVVHFLRTTTKRLRALLQLIRPVIAKTAFEREDARLKRIAIRLAPFRDRTVVLETLRAFVPRLVNPCKSSAANSTGTAHADGRREHAMRAAAGGLEQSRRGFHRLRIGGEGWEAVGPGLANVYTQARKRMKAASADPSDRAFHRWRIRVKQLYYQLQWLEPVWPKQFARMLKRLHKLGENLGADHDLAVLREVFGEIRGGFDGADAIGHVKKYAAKKSRRLRRASELLGAKALGKTLRRFRRSCQRRWRVWKCKGDAGGENRIKIRAGAG